MVLCGMTAFDPDDMFGVRRALRMLPEHLWDDFFLAWAGLADACELDPERMQVSAAREARARSAGGTGVGGTGAGAGSRPLADAWATVSDAMGSYLAWKASRSGSALLPEGNAEAPGTGLPSAVVE